MFPLPIKDRGYTGIWQLKFWFGIATKWWLVLNFRKCKIFLACVESAYYRVLSPWYQILHPKEMLTFFLDAFFCLNSFIWIAITNRAPSLNQAHLGMLHICSATPQLPPNSFILNHDGKKSDPKKSLNGCKKMQPKLKRAARLSFMNFDQSPLD